VRSRPGECDCSRSAGCAPRSPQLAASQFQECYWHLAGHASSHTKCPLLGVKRTSLPRRKMSPKADMGSCSYDMVPDPGKSIIAAQA
jgi:hypothetical protein